MPAYLLVRRLRDLPASTVDINADAFKVGGQGFDKKACKKGVELPVELDPVRKAKMSELQLSGMGGIQCFE